MKINWGTSIVIAMAAFVSFIMYFVVNMSTDKNLQHDLVTEEYYKKEVDFQTQMNREQNSLNLAENLRIERSTEGVVVHFPKDLAQEAIKGKIFLYRPSNKQLDTEIPVSLSSHQMLIPEKHLLSGRWNVEVTWEYEGEDYFYKQELLY